MNTAAGSLYNRRGRIPLPVHCDAPASHTHRPAVHSHDLGKGKQGERIVLADWYSKGSYLEVTAEGFTSKDL